MYNCVCVDNTCNNEVYDSVFVNKKTKSKKPIYGFFDFRVKGVVLRRNRLLSLDILY